MKSYNIMKSIQAVILSLLVVYALSECHGATSKKDCHGRNSTAKEQTKLDYRCCYAEALYKEKDAKESTNATDCVDTPYDGDYIFHTVESGKALLKFQGATVDYARLDCSAKWIKSFFGLFLAFLL